MQQPPALLIAGPTASGKSALATLLAERLGGTVVNADSMQVYRDLRALTARPGPADEARAPHALYGVRDAAEPASAAWWRQEALRAMGRARGVPVLCGGTGLYFHALTRGLAPVPEVGEAARTEARGLLAAEGAAALHARLLAADPETAAGLRPSDGQRLARAWEVWRGTGRGLGAWRREPPAGPPPPHRFLAVLLDPPREALRAAIRLRWDAALRDGATAEVAALLARGLDPALPAMRAHGVAELRDAIEGRASPAQATERACLAIGRYTKRQATWFRHHALPPPPAGHGAAPSAAHTIAARFTADTQLSESLWRIILAFVEGAR